MIFRFLTLLFPLAALLSLSFHLTLKATHWTPHSKISFEKKEEKPRKSSKPNPLAQIEMGCSQSKIENEEAVTRCKDRNQFIKSAVVSRNAFAAAHSSYIVSLKNTGAAISDFSYGESLSLSSSYVGGATTLHPHSQSQPPIDSLPPPPPPIPDISPSPLQRVTAPHFEVSRRPTSEPAIEEEEDEEGPTLSVVGRMENSTSGVVGMSPPPPPPEAEASNSSFDYFFNMENMAGGRLGVVEEIDCRVFDGMPQRTQVGVNNSSEGGGKAAKKGKQVVGPGAIGGGGGEGKRRNVNMVQVFVDLDDCFLKASESGHEVSKMLEAARLHYHSNFADNRGHIDHSATVMRVITWNRSFRGLPVADEYKDDLDSDENETHATVLDKLLAWEKKLYDEVKAGEIMKYEYQRKVTLLNKQKKRGTNSESMEKTKAAVSQLHTRYIVDMQTMDSTVLEINRLRDEQVYPKLVALVDAMATMWDAMQAHHENQLRIAGALRAVDISQSTKETTDHHHHERTMQLWLVVQEWHIQFDKMVNHQKEYVRSLNSWLKLNLIPIESSLKEKVSSPPRAQTPPIQRLLLAWNDLLEKLLDEHAKSAIYNFSALLQTIIQQQEDELKLKSKVEESRRDLEKKQRQYSKWLHEYMEKKIPSDETEQPSQADDGVHGDEIMAERESIVENAKKKLEDDEENYRRQCAHVSEKTLSSLKTRLPELFCALSDFAVASSEMYRKLGALSHNQKETSA